VTNPQNKFRSGEEERTDNSSLRRQSSAFEFRSSRNSHQKAGGQRVEPVYENLRRDASSRASLRYCYTGMCFVNLVFCWISFCFSSAIEGRLVMMKIVTVSFHL